MIRPRPWRDAVAQGLYEELARPGTVLAFDFDGTLAPLVTDRDAAAMRAHTAELFAGVCRRYDTLVISGRARHDVAARLGPAQPALVIGNHGAEGMTELPMPHLPAIREAARALQRVAGRARLDVEDKGLSLSVHLPREGSPQERQRGEALVRESLAPFASQLRVMPGHAVINVTLAAADHKGHALRREVRARRAARVLYVGDDVTDEDVFATDIPGLIGVHVGASATTAAGYFIASQEEIDPLLEQLRVHRPP